MASAAKPRKTNFEESNRREASLPGWAMLWIEKKNFFAVREWDDGAKNARGGIAEEVVLTFGARSDFLG